MQTVDDKTVISGLRWYASDQYGLLIRVGGVGGVSGDFSQTNCWIVCRWTCATINRARVAPSIHALSVLRCHGLNNAVLQTAYQVIIVARLTHPAPGGALPPLTTVGAPKVFLGAVSRLVFIELVGPLWRTLWKLLDKTTTVTNCDADDKCQGCKRDVWCRDQDETGTFKPWLVIRAYTTSTV